MTSVPLSVLDLAPVPAGGTSRQALADTVALAREVEQLGYGRFWVAEHHGMPGVASSAPAVLVGALAAAIGSRRSARVVVGSVPGARPSPRSMRPGCSAASVPNCSAIT